MVRLSEIRGRCSGERNILRILICALAGSGLIWLMTSCGTLAEDGDGTPVARDVEVSKSVESGQTTTLAIEAGSATGTEVSISEGSLESGTNLSLDRIDSPSEFSDIASSDGDGENTFATASSAININGTKDGSDVDPTSPMTLAIPYSGTSLAFWLQGVSRDKSNLCVILKSRKGKLYVFRNRLLSVDSGAKKVKFKSLFFGVYQLIYCGSKDLANFSDAGEEGVAATPPDADPKTFSSFGKEVSYSLTVDGSVYRHNAAHFCLGILTSADEDSDTSTVIAGGKFTATGSALEMTLSVDTAKIGNESEVFIALLLQNSSEACNWSPGDEFTGAPAFQRALLFNTTKLAVHKEEMNGTLGTGAYALKKYTIAVGAPDGAAVNLADPFAVEKACISAESRDAKGNTTGELYVNSPLLGISGQSVVVYAPNREGHTANASLLTGKTCQDSGGADHGSSHDIKLRRAASDGMVRLLPVSLETSGEIRQQKLLNPGLEICVELYPGDYTSGSTGSSDQEKTLGRWKMDGESLTTYVPWDPGKLSGGVPVYDLLFHAGSNCRSNFPSPVILVDDDKSLLNP